MAAVLYKWLMMVSVCWTLHFGGKDSGHQRDLHPFYISVTEMNYNAGEKNLEISCKIFTDDLETAIEKTYHQKTDLFAVKDKELANKHIAGYVRNNLVIKLDGKTIPLEFVGFERENEAVWSYLQGVNTPAPRTVEVMNKLLYDSFDQQINLVHVTVNGERKSARLINPETNLRFGF